VLVVGALENGAAARCVAAIEATVRLARVEHVADLAAASARLRETAGDAELVVLCESWPGQFAADKIDALRRMAPLARFWRLLGAWCEGERRSGHPPPGCSSTYWHQWPAQFALASSDTRHDRVAGWYLPQTITADERTLVEADVPIEPRSGVVVVRADRMSSAEALADACRLGGYEPRLASTRDTIAVPDAIAVVWDADPQQAGDANCVERLKSEAGGAPILAVIGFPRPDQAERLSSAGIAGVVSKPYRVRELLWQIAEVATARA
jgi:hypothetical protein